MCDGYIIRKETKGERRKTQLICTPAAEEIIKEGQVLQKDFLEHLFDNIRTLTIIISPFLMSRFLFFPYVYADMALASKSEESECRQQYKDPFLKM